MIQACIASTQNRTGSSGLPSFNSIIFRYEEHLINIWLVLLENYPDAVVAGNTQIQNKCQ